MCDTPTDVAVRIQSDLDHLYASLVATDSRYDDLVEFARALASKTTFAALGHDQPDMDMGSLGERHAAHIEQARSLCDALGVFWEGE